MQYNHFNQVAVAYYAIEFLFLLLGNNDSDIYK